MMTDQHPAGIDGQVGAATAGGQPMLSFDGAGKMFPDGTVAFTGVDLELTPGEFISIVGPSGCGKSTVLRVASGLDQVTSGTVTRPQSGTGFVFQDATLLPWRTVRRNVELLLELAGTSAPDRVDAALDLVGLHEFADHLPHQLSGGMRMRVSLARWLATQPRLFLFDEPFAALDEISRTRLQVELSRLFAAERFASLFITHSVFEAVFLSTRVLVMSKRPGEIVREFEIPFPHARTEDLRFDPEYTAICGEVSAALKAANQ